MLRATRSGSGCAPSLERGRGATGGGPGAARPTETPRRPGTPSALRRFGRNRNGVSAVEFALLLPMLMTVWAGFSEYAHAVDNWRKLTLLARTVADLTAQGDAQNPIDVSLMNDIMAASTLVLKPFNASGVKIVVSALGVDLKNLNLTPRVCSSFANSKATARGTGVASDLTVPVGYQTTGMRYILAEVSMPYTPVIGSALVKFVKGSQNPITLNFSVPWPARGGQIYSPNTYTEVVLPDSKSAACP